MRSERNDCCSMLAINLARIRALLNNVQLKVVRKSPVRCTHSVIVMASVLVHMVELYMSRIDTTCDSDNSVFVLEHGDTLKPAVNA
jgi:hypothetical protein